MRIKKAIYLLIGCISLGLGSVGAVLPMLPTFPFLLLAAVCFAKSSRRLHTWFTGTKLYKKNLESYVEGRGMSMAAKLRIMGTVSLIMGIGAIVMLLKSIYVPCIILGIVWMIHVLYFTFGVKTLKVRMMHEG